MKLVDKGISIEELKKMSNKMFGCFVKGVADIKKEIMVVDAAMHADEEKYLLESGSKQDDLWGFNIYPDLTGDDFIEFDSMINLKPNQNNRSRGIDDKKTQKRIIKIVNKLVEK